MRETVSGCNDYYSMFKEDEDAYAEGWERTNKTLNMTTSPWYYRSVTELGGIPFLGVTTAYSGGGYAYDLGVANVTDANLASLKDNSWIDSRTRAIFVEIAIYNAQLNLFGVATFLTEWIPTNGVLFFNNIKVTRLYRGGNDFDSVMVACEIFLALFFAIFLYSELKKMFRFGKAYFKDPWNWLEISQIILILTGAASLFQRTSHTNIAINIMKANPNQFVSFNQAIAWDELFGYFLAFLVFFANLKFLKLIRFNHRIFLFTKTLSTSAMPLLSFMVVFFIFYIAYSLLFYSFFGAILEEYRSFPATVETLFNTVMGGFDFEILRDNNRYFGPIIFFSFMMIMVMILMNVFLTILMDAFAEVQEEAENIKSEDAEVVDYMLDQFKQFFLRKGKVGDFSENEGTGDCDSAPNEVETCRSESGRETCQSPDENWLEGSHQELIRTVEPLEDSFSSMEKSSDHGQLRPEEYHGQRISPTWPSLASLRRELERCKRMSVGYSNEHPAPVDTQTEYNASCIFTASGDVHEPYDSELTQSVDTYTEYNASCIFTASGDVHEPYDSELTESVDTYTEYNASCIFTASGDVHEPFDSELTEPVDTYTEYNASCLFTASGDANEPFSRENSAVSHSYHEESSDKASTIFEQPSESADSGMHSPSIEYSQNSPCPTSENSVSVCETARESSSGYCSSFAGTESSKGKSENSLDSEVSHYYELLDVAVDRLRYEDDDVCTSLMSEAVDSDLLHYYDMLERAAKEQILESGDTLEKFDFANYKVRFNNISQKASDENDVESGSCVEPLLSNLLENFASVAISDLQEDQVYEQLFISYVTVLNEISFEPDVSSVERRRRKKFQEKAKWKYTRHMFTQE